MTVVLITHHMEECIGADRLLVMSNGSLVDDGTPAQVFSRVEEMEAEGLAVPETVRLAYDLNRRGFSLPIDTLDVSACADNILKEIR